jgi:DNA (cytosine-5)-methyltransferase 1
VKALDLFCCAGGASAGLVQAGFEVTGIDIDDQPNYPWTFIQADATDTSIEFIREFDFVWASPPCQFATAYKRRHNHVKPSVNLIPQTREMLDKAGVPYVIENVQGARHELTNPIMLCGSSFGLDIRRHRYFEAKGFPLKGLACDHGWQTPRFKPATNRTNLRSTVEVGVWRIPMDVQYKAMGGCWWMERRELSQAIPPAYSSFIARQFLEHWRKHGQGQEESDQRLQMRCSQAT